MQDHRKRRSRRMGWVAVLLALAVGIPASFAFHPWRKTRPTLEGIPRAAVRRADVRVSVTTSGRVDSSKKTEIKCQIEALEVGRRSSPISFGGSSTIIWLIPEGSVVKKGDILCELDASDYEELVRQQEIKVQEERTEAVQAKLLLESAEVAVREYQEGLKRQTEQDFRGQIALAEADLQRAKDRLVWTERMSKKGYASLASLANDRTAVQKAELNLENLRGAFDNLNRFGSARTLTSLQTAVEVARKNLVFETLRAESNEERLAHYKRQVELCTIRAPHDGFVIYATSNNSNSRVEEGATVRQRQDLFFLPDLDDMEVQAMLHESIVDRVSNGMQARVRVESLSGQILEGHVVSVSRLPYVNRTNFADSGEVKNYVGLVKLDSVPAGLRPGMTAEVEIVTGTRTDALVIPSEALTVEGGQDVCYVAGDQGLQRREVEVSQATTDLLEVTGGLEEGEEVVLNPGQHLGAVVPAEAPADEPEPVAGGSPFAAADL